MQNKYEVIGIVGEGAYGIVYKCKNKETGKYVAIKKFKEVGDDLIKKTMKRELKMLQRLHHPNIVQFQDAFKRKGNLFLVFEFVEKNLLELIEEHPKGLDPNIIRSIIYQLCKAIKYLHDQKIIHRDIKPENLLITQNNETKLCDFGFARLISGNFEKLTDYVATRWYRAPELLISQGEYGPEVDYWAIGCIMGELVDGNPLFPGENELDQIHCIQKLLGNLTEKQQNIFYSNPIFQGKNLLNITKPETLERKYFGKLNKQAINFMKGLLEIDPKKRLDGITVFQHPYFAKLVSNDNKLNKQIIIQEEIQNNNDNKKVININKINSKNENDKINANNNTGQNNQILKIKIIQTNHKINNNENNNIKKVEKNSDKNNEIKSNKDLINNNINNKSLVMNNNINNNNNYKQPNITNINIINYNTINENFIQNNCQNVFINNKNANEKTKNNINSIILKKPDINKIEINQKENNINKENSDNQNINSNNNINIIDNAYKTFYQKNKDKDIYNIKLNLGDCGSCDSNDIMNNINHENKYGVINEVEEFTPDERMKIAQISSLYKNNGQKHGNDDKSPGKMNYLQKISPSKNYYCNNNYKNLNYSKNNFQLPVIFKGTAYNNYGIFNHKKHNNYY